MKLTHLPLPEKKTVVPSVKIQPNCFHTETKRNRCEWVQINIFSYVHCTGNRHVRDNSIHHTGANTVCVYRKSSAENMPLARRRMESLDASYGCSLDGISNTAGIDCMWASMAWRIISAMNWLIRMMPMSLRAKKLLDGGRWRWRLSLEQNPETLNHTSFKFLSV